MVVVVLVAASDDEIVHSWELARDIDYSGAGVVTSFSLELSIS